MDDLKTSFLHETVQRLERLSSAESAASIDAAAAIIASAIEHDGIVHAFGTGHSEAFSMEIAGRAGGLIPTSKIALRDIVVHGSRDVAELTNSQLEREPSVVDELWDGHVRHPNDVYIIASNSGVNGSIVGFALKVKEQGHSLIAVTSMDHTMKVEPKHPSGKRLCEVADVVIDNLGPYGDTTLNINDQVSVGAISSLTSAFIAQLITISVTKLICDKGVRPPLYISANIPGGDAHNDVLLARYTGRLRRDA